MTFSACLSLGAALVGAPGVAQNLSYPERPARFLIGFVAGGAVDRTARTIAQALSERWGQSIIVDNRPGGLEVVYLPPPRRSGLRAG